MIYLLLSYWLQNQRETYSSDLLSICSDSMKIILFLFFPSGEEQNVKDWPREICSEQPVLPSLPHFHSVLIVLIWKNCPALRVLLSAVYSCWLPLPHTSVVFEDLCPQPAKVTLIVSSESLSTFQTSVLIRICLTRVQEAFL